MRYLTNASKDTNDIKNTLRGSSVGDNISDKVYDSEKEYFEHVIGKRSFDVSFSKMIEEYRDIIVNIDMKVIEEMGELFFGLWGI